MEFALIIHYLCFLLECHGESEYNLTSVSVSGVDFYFAMHVFRHITAYRQSETCSFGEMVEFNEPVKY